MAEPVLQKYLNCQFIKTTEQGNLASLRKAIVEVAKQLEKKKSKIVSYTLVAIDPQIEESDPVVEEVEKIIIKKWPAFRNSVSATKDKPTTYIRAVILEALTKLSANEEYAALIWYTSRNLFSHYKLGREADVILPQLQIFANKTETSAQDLLGLNAIVDLPQFSIPEIEMKGKIISRTNLTERLYAAAGPSSTREGGNIANENANRFWPGNNHNWAGEFGRIAGEAISSSINKVLQNQNAILNNVGNEINLALSEIGPFFQDIQKVILNNVEASYKRSQLLWWKESLYSPILNNSYRTQESVTASLLMAIDLSKMISPIYPFSVDFLLRETLKDVHGEEVYNKHPLKDLIARVSEIDERYKSHFKQLIRNDSSRKPLFSAIANKFNGSDKDIFKQVGINDDTEISLSDFSVWLLHDLQASRIASKK